MLVHICCAVDSHYFLEKLQEEFPNEKIVGFFYDPNIHPYNEYRLRYYDVEYSCKKLGIELLEGPYNLEEWLKKVKGLENEPEKGDRCTVCFDDRLETSVKKAIELGHDKFTTTLLISPKKSQDKLEKIGKDLEEKYKCQFIFRDYRSGNGTQKQGEVVKENSLYRQNYCGCIYALNAQREHQNKIMDEMFSPISKQILPESIESRLELYKKRDDLQEQGIPFKIIKQRFLNYRLLRGTVKIDKKIVPSYILCYSTLSKRRTSANIVYEKNEIFYLGKDEVKLLSLQIFNDIGNSSYKNVKSLIFNPPTFESELNIRDAITKNPYGLSTIIIVDEVIDGKYEIELDSVVYEDVKEVII
ncbi:diacylglucosamine hydrolase like protein [Halarcobacter ebronensis]|uniref:Epoxyqueuosine reductase QueH n=1 Tax=Halarcobacter ebronensis TaxID=1462615 RepID=A0A4V1LR32_9BACT|nr:epoxyqueuosine reductase QueH [Halarcobacter ebronensis]RXJ66788.1 diacylglucosamine hydrolase like protein [Halarcobacter ebronensis]